MTNNNSIKQAARARMLLTGENYTTALSHLYDRKNVDLNSVLNEAEYSLLNSVMNGRNGGLVLVGGYTAVGKTGITRAILGSRPQSFRQIVHVAHYNDMIAYQETVNSYTPSCIVMYNKNPEHEISLDMITESIRYRADIYYIDELKSNEQANLISRMACTGHVVVATVHTPIKLEDAIFRVRYFSDEISWVPLVTLIQIERIRLAGNQYDLVAGIVQYKDGVRIPLDGIVSLEDKITSLTARGVIEKVDDWRFEVIKPSQIID